MGSQRDRDSRSPSWLLRLLGQTGTCGCHCAAQMLPTGRKTIFLMPIFLQVPSSLAVSPQRSLWHGALWKEPYVGTAQELFTPFPSSMAIFPSPQFVLITSCLPISMQAPHTPAPRSPSTVKNVTECRKGTPGTPASSLPLDEMDRLDGEGHNHVTLANLFKPPLMVTFSLGG